MPLVGLVLGRFMPVGGDHDAGVRAEESCTGLTKTWSQKMHVVIFRGGNNENIYSYH